MIISLIRQHPKLALGIGLGGAVLLAGLVLGIVLLTNVYASPPQPLPYDHNAHIEAGTTCLYCHAGAARGESAGIPSLAKCMGCHASIEATSPESQKMIEPLIAKWEAGEAVQWIKINDQPDFVQFLHRPHVANGVACESCHGNVSEMGYARPYNLNMGFCLDCHRKQAPEDVTRLLDCATCHY